MTAAGGARQGVRGDPFPRCDHEDGCITCGDEAVAMKLLWLEHEPGLALCADGDGRTQTVDVGLVDAGAGDRVLVHAGTALMRIEQEAHA